MKTEIRNNEKCSFLLKAKATDLKKEIEKVEDILHTIKTSTPVEEVKTTDEKEVLVGDSFKIIITCVAVAGNRWNNYAIMHLKKKFFFL